MVVTNPLEDMIYEASETTTTIVLWMLEWLESASSERRQTTTPWKPFERVAMQGKAWVQTLYDVIPLKSA